MLGYVLLRYGSNLPNPGPARCGPRFFITSSHSNCSWYCSCVISKNNQTRPEKMSGFDLDRTQRTGPHSPNVSISSFPRQPFCLDPQNLVVWLIRSDKQAWATYEGGTIKAQTFLVLACALHMPQLFDRVVLNLIERLIAERRRRRWLYWSTSSTFHPRS